MKLNQISKAVIKNRDKIPARFVKTLERIASLTPDVSFHDSSVKYPPSQRYISFGVGNDKNTIHIGGRFLDKKSQYSKFKGKVNTLKTYTDTINLNLERMIAKKATGERQQGQMINKIPDNPDDYIFQNLVDIVAEYRVIVYKLNGEFFVSGIYEKSGSNVSIKQIPKNNKVGKVISEMAINATKLLGYSFGGVDIAIVRSSNASDVVLGESIIGGLSSTATKLLGKLSDDKILDENIPVILEVNSFPSLANPAILHDLLASLIS